MTDIPNGSKSPYFLRRMEARGLVAGGDVDARSGPYSLRSIPAWDPSYLGSSLLAKRIRKTLVSVEDRLNTIATGGVDYALLEQMVNTVIGGMNLEGLNEAEVKALIAAAVASLPDFGITEPAVTALIAQALADLGPTLQTGAGLTAEQAVVLGQVQPLLDLLAVKPGATVTDVEVVWQAVSDANTAIYSLINILAGKPGGGGTIADVATVFGSLGATIQQMLDTAIAALPEGLTEDQVNALIAAALAGLPEALTADEVDAQIEAKLTMMGPAIQQAVASQAGKVNDRMTLHKTDSGDGDFIIETNNMTGAQWKVGVNVVLQRGADFKIDGNRVLTTADALEAGGGGIDQAALEAAVQAATAALTDRIDGLQNQVMLLTQYIDQQVGTVIQYVDMEIEKKADKTVVESVSEQASYAVAETQRLEAQDAEIVAWVVENYAEKDYVENLESAIVDQFSRVLTDIVGVKKLVQDFMDALNGPDATVQSITEMFWLLNDVMVALIEATGIDFPGGK
jgi:hypothetical protein